MYKTENTSSKTGKSISRNKTIRKGQIARYRLAIKHFRIFFISSSRAATSAKRASPLAHPSCARSIKTRIAGACCSREKSLSLPRMNQNKRADVDDFLPSRALLSSARLLCIGIAHLQALGREREREESARVISRKKLPAVIGSPARVCAADEGKRLIARARPSDWPVRVRGGDAMLRAGDTVRVRPM